MSGALDRDAILSEGAARTGGDGNVDEGASWVHALDVLVDSTNREGRLNTDGAAAMGEKLTDLTSERLRAETLLRAHPELAGRPISVRFAVSGFARSGTTVLHRLLGCDPDVDFLPTWQAFRPVPAGPCAPADDPRRDEMIAAIEMMKQMGALAVHPMSTDEPEEEVFLLQHSFASLLFELNCPMPSFVEWLGATDQRGAYEFVFDLIRLNQWAAGAPTDRPRVAKSPQFLFDLATVLDVMPGAVIAVTHRDPVEVVGSYCSIYANGRRRFMDDVDLHEVGVERVGELERIARRAAEARAAADPARFVDVQYSQLMTDPIGVVEQIYAAGNVDLSGATCDAVRAWLTANPQGAGGRHAYDLADYGLDPDDIREHFATA
jgi:Sulfotransferase family